MTCHENHIVFALGDVKVTKFGNWVVKSLVLGLGDFNDFVYFILCVLLRTLLLNSLWCIEIVAFGIIN